VAKLVPRARWNVGSAKRVHSVVHGIGMEVILRISRPSYVLPSKYALKPN